MATLAEVLRQAGYVTPQGQVTGPRTDLAQKLKSYVINIPQNAAQNLANQRADIDAALTMGQGGIQIGDREAFARQMAEVPNLMGLTAYHGTPHTIKGKFDITKMGTGVGQQHQGAGMYFTKQKELAETYAPSFDQRELENTLFRTGGNIQEAINNVKKEAQYLVDKNAPKSTIDETMGLWKALEKMQEGKIPTKGNIYKVDIPDEIIPKMVDYDKPLGQQNETIQQLFAEKIPSQYMKLGNFLQKAYRDEKLAGKLIGKDKANAQELSEWLNANGVTGIKYYESISRTGKPAENYVVFEPSKVKILEENSKPVTRKQIIKEQIENIEK